jgi:glycosyltransferase involved in cell wall biosynthesis
MPDISVIIPVFNRGALVRHTLASVRAASTGLEVETVLVDDGSSIPLADDLARLGLRIDRLIRQENHGLLFARLTGFAAATGKSVLFLDSDDLLSPDKLVAHVAAHRAGADVAYSDSAQQNLDDQTGPLGVPAPCAPDPATTDPAEFFITIQPAPHAPSYRTDYLRARIAEAPFPPSPLYNPVAEIWCYHICAPFPANVMKCAGLAIGGRHPGARLTNHWERLAIASLAVQEAFARTLPDTPEGRRAAAPFAIKAFASWRRLPRGFDPELCARQLELWRRFARDLKPACLGGALFKKTARLLGAETASRIFRLRNTPYSTCRTLDKSQLTALIASLPPP